MVPSAIEKDIRYIKGVGEKRAKLFENLGVSSVDTLLHLYPRNYRDWSDIKSLNECALSPIPFCFKATVVTGVAKSLIRKGLEIFKCLAVDENGTKVEITIFNNRYSAEKLLKNEEYTFFAKVTYSRSAYQVTNPEFFPTVLSKKIEPIYPQTKGLNTKYIEKTVLQSLKEFGHDVEDFLPKAIIDKFNLMSESEAIVNIHFPSSLEALKQARTRLIFDEFFVLQAAMLSIKNHNREKTSISVIKDYSKDFVSSLPFKLTNAQQKAIDDCLLDFKKSVPMNRLIQGDVGSGKTVVAAAISYTVAMNGFQCAIMAPTEILARQHKLTFEKFFKDYPVKIALLTGSTKAKEKSEILERLKSGDIQIIIGTHALIQNDVVFNNLGLVVTDEQHRFGVAQRDLLTSKSQNPHVMVMSATPIPRTLSLIVYGDLDISIIDELPPGRIAVKTYLIDKSKLKRSYGFIKKHLDEGHQAYIVCPLIDEAEEPMEESQLGLVSAQALYDNLSKHDFKDYSLGLIHGKLKPKEKDDVMSNFVNGKIQLLISTTVIEVGVDVPNAVIMEIQNAERFGLSQLHQLRGRVGRGSDECHCILVSDNASEKTVQRLKVLTSTTNGFKVADEDLKLRGPGDFFGVKQHGVPNLKIADISEDFAIMEDSKQALQIIHSGKDISKEEIIKLNKQIKKVIKTNLN